MAFSRLLGLGTCAAVVASISILAKLILSGLDRNVPTSSAKLPESQTIPPGVPQPQASVEPADMHVVYACDSTQFVGLLTSMVSLVGHLLEPRRCQLHVIVPEDDMEQAEGLVACFRHLGVPLPYLPQVTLHKLQATPFDGRTRNQRPNDNGVRVFESGNIPIMATLVLPWYLGTVKKALYLDTDTLVVADVGPLFRIPTQHPLAAVTQHYSSLNVTHKHLPSSLIPPSKGITLNSGVMLYDLEQWRSKSITHGLEFWMEVLSRHEFAFDSQLLLNLEFNFNHSYDILNISWNNQGLGFPCVELLTYHPKFVEKMRADLFASGDAAPRILHYSGGIKPWLPYAAHMCFPEANSIWHSFAPKADGVHCTQQHAVEST